LPQAPKCGSRTTRQLPNSRGLLRLALLPALLFAPSHATRAGQAIDVRIVLAADVSRSIDADEFTLQQRGYANAISDPRVIDAILAGRHGAIAVSFVEWAGTDEQRTIIDWKVIASADDARAFADALANAPRAFLGRTAIGSAIDYSAGVLAESGYDADRSVIDVSGDGTSNQGRMVTEARDAAVGAGVTINGLSIFNRTAAAMGGYLALHTNPPGGIDKYYRDYVIGGLGAFVIRIDNFTSFEQAMIQKLITEISERTEKSAPT
jgi:hypothetical protein